MNADPVKSSVHSAGMHLSKSPLIPTVVDNKGKQDIWRSVGAGLAACTLMFSMKPAYGFQPGGRLLATGGVTQIEGAAGGGLVPWALIAGYGTRNQVGATIFYTQANPSDFSLSIKGMALGLFDRVELSVAEQQFGLGSTVPGRTIRQEVVGIKLKLTGDAIFDQDNLLPQIAAGLQFKNNQDFDPVPRALGARRSSGIDFYVAATKLYLGAVWGRNLLLNGTLRATKANQMGILGFGGDLSDSYGLHFESSAALFLNDNLLIGAEYRHKPNNLSVFKENAYRDFFLAYLPNKYLAMTAAYALLGNIANKPDQKALYISLQLGF